MGRLEDKYLIWGYYGHGNLGDELMLRVIVDQIRSHKPGATVYVRCLNKPAAENIIPLQIERMIRIPVLKQFVYILRQISAISKIDTLVIGGGIIPEDDIPGLKEKGIAEIFTPGTPTSVPVEFIKGRLSLRPVP